MVGIFLDNPPSLFLGIGSADAKLVRDRRVALAVTRVTDLERDLHERSPL